MNVRERRLPPGWYPEEPAEIDTWIEQWEEEDRARSSPDRASAGIAPHAGWYYSGGLSYLVVRAIDPAVETVVVVGGHLPAGGPVLSAPEDGYATPLGDIPADAELRRALLESVNCAEDLSRDNTVEVQLPLVHHLLPHASALSLRAPAGRIAVELGRRIAECAERLGRRVAVVGSTDLTHYGPQYRFTPRGMGEAALRWVRESNDAGMIEAFLSMDPVRLLKYAAENHAACSAGGAAAAVSFAAARGAKSGRLLSYRTSRDRGPSSSFVGYAAVIYS